MKLRWQILAASLILAVLACLLVPAMEGGSNCGGNSAALAACQHLVRVLETWQENHPGKAFSFDEADAETRRQLTMPCGASWIRSARLLAVVEDVRINPAGDKRIVIVCDRAYDNVPRHALWRAPATHAVAYSTGETELISITEFANLDLAHFVDLQTIDAENAIGQRAE